MKLAELGVDGFLHQNVDQFLADGSFLNQQLLVLAERIKSQELLGPVSGLTGREVTTVSLNVVPETHNVGGGLCSCRNKPGLHYGEVSDESVGSDVGVDFLDEIRRDVRVGA